MNKILLTVSNLLLFALGLYWLSDVHDHYLCPCLAISERFVINQPEHEAHKTGLLAVGL